MTAFVEDESVLSRGARPCDEVLSYGPDPDHVVEVWRPVGSPRNVLALLVHGGFWRPRYDRTHLRPAAAALADSGWTVALPEYRRIPSHPDASLTDVRRAAELAPTLVAPGLDVVTLGHSAGGHLVLWLAATTAPVRGTLALAPVADLQLSDELGLGDGAVRAFLGTEAQQWPGADPAMLPSPGTAVTVVQGAEDAVVPPVVAQSYAGRHPRTRLVTLPATGHFALIDPLSPAWATVTAELNLLSR